MSVYSFLKSCTPEECVMGCSVREKHLYHSLGRRARRHCVCAEPGNSGLPLEGPLGPTLKRLLTRRAACNREPCQKWEDRLSIRERDHVVESRWKIEKLKIQTERIGIGPGLLRPHRVGVGSVRRCGWSKSWLWTDPHHSYFLSLSMYVGLLLFWGLDEVL